jgi:heme exporter protein CcmD
MMDLGKYAVFILPAYGATILVLGGLLVDSLLRSRKWRREAEAREAERKKPS